MHPERNQAESPGLSVARLLDQLRQLLVKAWDEDRRPQYALIHPRLYRAILEARRREASSGRPLTLLGLEIRSAEQVPLDRPEIH